MKTYIICFGLLLTGCDFHSGGDGHDRPIIVPDTSFAELGDAGHPLEDGGQENIDGEVEETPQAGSRAQPHAGTGSAGTQEPRNSGNGGSISASGGAGSTSADSGAAGSMALDADVQGDGLTFEGDNAGPGLFCDPCTIDEDCGPRLLCLAHTVCVARKPTNGLCNDVCPATPQSAVSGEVSGAFCQPIGGFPSTACDLEQDEQGRCE